MRKRLSVAAGADTSAAPLSPPRSLPLPTSVDADPYLTVLREALEKVQLIRYTGWHNGAYAREDNANSPRHSGGDGGGERRGSAPFADSSGVDNDGFADTVSSHSNDSDGGAPSSFDFSYSSATGRRSDKMGGSRHADGDRDYDDDRDDDTRSVRSVASTAVVDSLGEAVPWPRIDRRRFKLVRLVDGVISNRRTTTNAAAAAAAAAADRRRTTMVSNGTASTGTGGGGGATPRRRQTLLGVGAGYEDVLSSGGNSPPPPGGEDDGDFDDDEGVGGGGDSSLNTALIESSAIFYPPRQAQAVATAKASRRLHEESAARRRRATLPSADGGGTDHHHGHRIGSGGGEGSGALDVPSHAVTMLASTVTFVTPAVAGGAGGSSPPSAAMVALPYDDDMRCEDDARNIAGLLRAFDEVSRRLGRYSHFKHLQAEMERERGMVKDSRIAPSPSIMAQTQSSRIRTLFEQSTSPLVLVATMRGMDMGYGAGGGRHGNNGAGGGGGRNAGGKQLNNLFATFKNNRQTYNTPFLKASGDARIGFAVTRLTIPRELRAVDPNFPSTAQGIMRYLIANNRHMQSLVMDCFWIFFLEFLALSSLPARYLRFRQFLREEHDAMERSAIVRQELGIPTDGGRAHRHKREQATELIRRQLHQYGSGLETASFLTEQRLQQYNTILNTVKRADDIEFEEVRNAQSGKGRSAAASGATATMKASISRILAKDIVAKATRKPRLEERLTLRGAFLGDGFINETSALRAVAGIDMTLSRARRMLPFHLLTHSQLINATLPSGIDLKAAEGAQQERRQASAKRGGSVAKRGGAAVEDCQVVVALRPSTANAVCLAPAPRRSMPTLPPPPSSSSPSSASPRASRLLLASANPSPSSPRRPLFLPSSPRQQQGVVATAATALSSPLANAPTKLSAMPPHVKGACPPPLTPTRPFASRPSPSAASPPSAPVRGSPSSSPHGAAKAAKAAKVAVGIGITGIGARLYDPRSYQRDGPVDSPFPSPDDYHTREYFELIKGREAEVEGGDGKGMGKGKEGRPATASGGADIKADPTRLLAIRNVPTRDDVSGRWLSPSSRPATTASSCRSASGAGSNHRLVVSSARSPLAFGSNAGDGGARHTITKSHPLSTLGIGAGPGGAAMGGAAVVEAPHAHRRHSGETTAHHFARHGAHNASHNNLSILSVATDDDSYHHQHVAAAGRSSSKARTEAQTALLPSPRLVPAGSTATAEEDASGGTIGTAAAPNSTSPTTDDEQVPIPFVIQTNYSSEVDPAQCLLVVADYNGEREELTEALEQHAEGERRKQLSTSKGAAESILAEAAGPRVEVCPMHEVEARELVKAQSLILQHMGIATAKGGIKEDVPYITAAAIEAVRGEQDKLFSRMSHHLHRLFAFNRLATVSTAQQQSQSGEGAEYTAFGLGPNNSNGEETVAEEVLRKSAEQEHQKVLRHEASMRRQQRRTASSSGSRGHSPHQQSSSSGKAKGCGPTPSPIVDTLSPALRELKAQLLAPLPDVLAHMVWVELCHWMPYAEDLLGPNQRTDIKRMLTCWIHGVENTQTSHWGVSERDVEDAKSRLAHLKMLRQEANGVNGGGGGSYPPTPTKKKATPPSPPTAAAAPSDGAGGDKRQSPAIVEEVAAPQLAPSPPLPPPPAASAAVSSVAQAMASLIGGGGRPSMDSPPPPCPPPLTQEERVAMHKHAIKDPRCATTCELTLRELNAMRLGGFEGGPSAEEEREKELERQRRARLELRFRQSQMAQRGGRGSSSGGGRQQPDAKDILRQHRFSPANRTPRQWHERGKKPTHDIGAVTKASPLLSSAAPGYFDMSQTSPSMRRFLTDGNATVKKTARSNMLEWSQ